MKKSLIALAVLAASGAAMAQSSVTLYGLVDVNLSSQKVDTGTSTTTTGINSGGFNGSRWGMKGSEDLGGGLKANFNLESGFGIDTGAQQQGGLLFGRQAWVGLSGGFGATRLGRSSTPFYDVDATYDALWGSLLSPAVQTFRTTTGFAGTAGNTGANSMTTQGAAARTDNTIRYDSPVMGGFSAAISHSLNEKAALATAPSATYSTSTVGVSVTSLAVTYAGGPLSANLAYQTEGKYNPAAGTSDRNFTRLQGSYDFGGIIARAVIGKAANINNVSGADATEYMLGADYAASTALTLSASYASSKDNATQSNLYALGGSGDVERKGLGLGAKYALSKRTFVYGGFEADTVTRTGTTDRKHQQFAAGVQHRF